MHWLFHETCGPIFWMDRTGGYKETVSDQWDFPACGATNLSTGRRLPQVSDPVVGDILWTLVGED